LAAVVVEAVETLVFWLEEEEAAGGAGTGSSISRPVGKKGKGMRRGWTKRCLQGVFLLN